jgi:hypothetical protein
MLTAVMSELPVTPSYEELVALLAEQAVLIESLRSRRLSRGIGSCHPRTRCVPLEGEVVSRRRGRSDKHALDPVCALIALFSVR